MNIPITTLLCMLMCPIVHAGQEVSSVTQEIPTSQAGNTTVNIYFDGSSHTGVTQEIKQDQKAQHSSTQKTDAPTQAISLLSQDVPQQLYDFCDKQRQKAQTESMHFVSWIFNNKIKTAATIILTSYAVIQYQIYQASLIINSPQAWSNWQNNKSLTDLFAIDHSTLESDLLRAIQARYVHPSNPTDFIYSIVQASNCLHHEIKIVEEQLNRYAWIKACKTTDLFLISLKDIEAVAEKHKKLLFLKHIFSSWCANYKIDKNS